MNHEVSGFFFGGGGEFSLFCSLRCSNKGLGISASFRFYHSSPLILFRGPVEEYSQKTVSNDTALLTRGTEKGCQLGKSLK